MPIIKEKYDISNIYNDFKEDLYVLRNRVVNGKRVAMKVAITYKEFTKVIYAYFEIKFEELIKFGFEKDIELSLISGDFALRKYIQTRSFHLVKDSTESFKQGKTVKYKIPILDDYYTKILWQRRKNGFGQLLVKIGHAPNKARKELAKRVGFDKFKMAEK